MSSVYNDYYEDQLKLGNEFEDYAVDVLLIEYGIIVQLYTSKKYQHTKGESRQKIEIKRDSKFKETGNLYIETHEKRPTSSVWKESGIYRGDSIWYLIGNESEFYFFAIKHLRELEPYCRQTTTGNEQGETSQGFLLPIAQAEISSCFIYRRGSF